MPNEKNGKKILMIILILTMLLMINNLIYNINMLDFGFLIINIVYFIKLLMIKRGC